jgi:type II secretory pathway component PulF
MKPPFSRISSATIRLRQFLPVAEISSTHRTLFFQQMEMLLSSGVMIADALAHLAARFPDKRVRRVVCAMQAEVAESRQSLSQAFAAFPRSFSPTVIAVIEAGEQSGSAQLAQRFAELAERAAFEDAHRREVRRACVYPAFMTVLAASLFCFLLEVVYPRLTDLLSSLGSELPPLARILIAVATWARGEWPILAAALIAAPILLMAVRRIPSAGRRIDHWFLKLPIAGPIYRDATVALICKIYRSLHLANQPAPASIDLCSRLVGNRAFREGLATARRRITQDGATLSAALSDSGLFPPLACLAIEVGEQTGRIAPALERVSVYFSARARDRLDAAIAFLNPALTLAIVGGTGVILISFFQSAYQIVYATH